MPDEHVHCPECGCLLPELQERIRGLERDLVAKRSRIAKLEGDRAHKAESSPHYRDALEVLEHWRTHCAPKTKELNGKRLENTIERLKGGYTKDQLMVCVLGYASKPYWRRFVRSATGKRDELRIDARIIFASAEAVDTGLALFADSMDEGLMAKTAVERTQLELGL